MIADRDQADHHRAHLAQNRSQNQALEGGCFNHLSRLIDRPTPDFLALSLTSSPAWAAALQALVDSLGDLESDDSEGWAAVTMLVVRLADAGLPITAAARAVLHYRAGQLGRAVELWEQANDRGKQEYRIAKAFTAPYPEKLAALQELGKRDDIVAEFSRSPNVKLSREQAQIVGRAFLHRSDYDRALPPLVDGLDGSAVAQLVIGAQSRQPGLALHAALSLFGVAAMAGDWAEVVPYLDGRSLPFVKKPNEGLTAWMILNKEILDLGLLRALARADSLADLKWEGRHEKVRQRPFAEFLQRKFFAKDRPIIGVDHWIELGAAVERTGNRTNALRFYEVLRADESLPPERRRHAAERWIACKERQARFTAQDGDSKNAAAMMLDARKERERLGLAPEFKLTEYPVLEPLAQYLIAILEGIPPNVATRKGQVASEMKGEQQELVPEVSVSEEEQSRAGSVLPNSRQEWTIAGLRFEFFPDACKVIVTGANGATASIKPIKGTCVGDD